jgi:hypothetical protein
MRCGETVREHTPPQTRADGRAESLCCRYEVSRSRGVEAKRFADQHVLLCIVVIPRQRRSLGHRMRREPFCKIALYIRPAGNWDIPHHAQRLDPTTRHRRALGGDRPITTPSRSGRAE